MSDGLILELLYNMLLWAKCPVFAFGGSEISNAYVFHTQYTSFVFLRAGNRLAIYGYPKAVGRILFLRAL